MIQFDDSVMYLNDDEWHIRPGLLTYVLLVSNISFLIYDITFYHRDGDISSGKCMHFGHAEFLHNERWVPQ